MKKKKDEVLQMAKYFIVFCFGVLFSIGISCTGFIKKYPADNPIEEWVESIIEKKTGLDLDLSPWEPEEGKENADTQ